MIFAAGFGTRMGALTRDLPKPMLTVNGRPLIDHAIDHVTGAGIRRIAVNTHYLADVIEDHLADTPVTILRETPNILETGGGLKAALPALGPAPVVTFNPDALFVGPNPVQALLSAWRDDMGALLLLVPRDRARCHAGQGDFDRLSDGRLQRRTGSVADYIYVGVQILDPKGLSSIPQDSFSLNLLWDQMLADQTVHGVVYDGDWVDVGTPAGLATARQLAGGR